MRARTRARSLASKGGARALVFWNPALPSFPEPYHAKRIVRTWHEGAIAPLATEHQESVHTLSPLPLSLPALCVALGLLPGWIFRCFPARGMRPIPGRPRARGPGLHATPSPARAPPGVIPPRLRPSRRLKHLFRTPHPGPLSHVYFVAIS